MNQKFVSQSNYVLRKVLNSQNNLDILKDFIESILNFKIVSIRLNPYLENKAKFLPAEENFGIADVRIKTESNEEFNIGIQFIDGMYVQNKLFLYYAQIHANQLEYKANKKIVRTITINILDFKYFSSKGYHKRIFIKDKTGTSENAIELHILELPKFKVLSKDKLTNKELWMLYLKRKDSKEIKEIIRKSTKIQKLDKLLDNYWKEEKME